MHHQWNTIENALAIPRINKCMNSNEITKNWNWYSENWLVLRKKLKQFLTKPLANLIKTPLKHLKHPKTVLKHSFAPFTLSNSFNRINWKLTTYETRLGLQCQNPLSFYPFCLWPYPLALTPGQTPLSFYHLGHIP